MKIVIVIFFFSLKKDNRTIGHDVTLVKDQCRLREEIGMKKTPKDESSRKQNEMGRTCAKNG